MTPAPNEARKFDEHRAKNRALMLPVAVLCGGKGTRIASLAGDLPKALLPVNGEPFLAHQFRRLRDGGARDVVLLIGYRGEAIRAFAGDGRAFGLRVRFSDDGDVPLGTAGALRRALPLLGDAFFAVYGDALSSTDLTPIARALAPPYEGVMTVYRNEDRWLPSNVTVEGDRVRDYSKEAALGTMTHIDFGINVFRSEVFTALPADATADLAQVHRAMIERRTLYAFSVPERFYEIGSPEGLAATERYLANNADRGFQTS